MNEYNLLSQEDIRLCQSKIGSVNQLAFGVMLIYFKIYIRFPAFNIDPIPVQLIKTVSAALELTQDNILDFDWGSRTTKRFRNKIREYLGYRESTDEDSLSYIDYLKQEILSVNPSDEMILEQSRLYFQKHKIEQFSAKQLKRYIKSAQYQFEQDLFQTVVDHLSSSDYHLIDQILTEDVLQPNEDIIALVELKKDIPGARLKNVNLAIKKIELLSKISLPKTLCTNQSRKLLVKYHDRIMALSPSNILEFSTTAKYASVAIF